MQRHVLWVVSSLLLLVGACDRSDEVVSPSSDPQMSLEATTVLLSTTGFPIMDLGNIPGGTDGQALDINNRGEAVGRIYIRNGESGGHDGFWWTSSDGIQDAGLYLTNINNRGRAIGYGSGPGFVLWTAEDGIIQDLPLFYATDINDAGQVVGYGYTAEISIWSATQGIETLGDPPGYSASDCLPDAINNMGQVVVHCRDDGYSSAQAFMWTRPTGWRNLGNLPGGGRVLPSDMNDRGQVTGSVYSGVDWVARAFLWTASTGMQELANLPGGSESEAWGINNPGQVVGRCGAADGLIRACLWTTTGEVWNLGTFPYGGWSQASHINDRGQVTGESQVHGVGANPALWVVHQRS